RTAAADRACFSTPASPVSPAMPLSRPPPAGLAERLSAFVDPGVLTQAARCLLLDDPGRAAVRRQTAPGGAATRMAACVEFTPWLPSSCSAACGGGSAVIRGHRAECHDEWCTDCRPTSHGMPRPAPHGGPRPVWAAG